MKKSILLLTLFLCSHLAYGQTKFNHILITNDDDYEKSFSVIPDWIKEFISSGFIDELGKNSYLTVGIPRIPFDEIKGVRLAERRASYCNPELFSFNKIYGEEPDVSDNETIWVLKVTGNPINQDTKYDDYYLQQGFIIITPMTIDENDNDLMHKLREKTDLIPKFYK